MSLCKYFPPLRVIIVIGDYLLNNTFQLEIFDNTVNILTRFLLSTVFFMFRCTSLLEKYKKCFKEPSTQHSLLN